jgi:polyisoprenoid-binding protein YceI
MPMTSCQRTTEARSLIKLRPVPAQDTGTACRAVPGHRHTTFEPGKVRPCLRPSTCVITYNTYCGTRRSHANPQERTPMPNAEPWMTAQPASAHAIPPGTYLADSARSQLSIRAKAFGLIWVHGHMPAVGGTIHVSEGRLRGAGEVAASRVSTGLRARDWHLRTRHYLHTTQHPNIQLSVDDADIASGHADFRVIARGKTRQHRPGTRLGPGQRRNPATAGTRHHRPLPVRDAPPAIRRVPARTCRTDRGGHASRNPSRTTVKARPGCRPDREHGHRRAWPYPAPAPLYARPFSLPGASNGSH